MRVFKSCKTESRDSMSHSHEFQGYNFFSIQNFKFRCIPYNFSNIACFQLIYSSVEKSYYRIGKLIENPSLEAMKIIWFPSEEECLLTLKLISQTPFLSVSL